MHWLDLQGCGIYVLSLIAAISAAVRRRVVENKRSLKVIITGSSGLVGRALSSFLNTLGYEVLALKRGGEPHCHHSLFWDPSCPEKTDLKEWEGCEAVIHLAGAGIAEKLWSAKRKKELYDSRVTYTKSLVSLLFRLKNPPRVFLSASAIGYYGDREEELLTETSPLGTGFLAQLCEEWEKASLPLLSRNTRLIHARFGVILSKEGGILSKILPIYQWGLGGVLGGGEQFVSWITLSDLVRAISFCLNFPQMKGAVNLVSPHPVKQREFAHVLADVLHRPCVLPVPQKLAKIVLGQMAEELLFSSQNVSCKKLLKAGFSFRYPALGPALQEMLS